jgi:hypothetical protein
MERVLQGLRIFKVFNFVRLPHHGKEEPPHAFNCCVFELKSASLIIVKAPVREGEPPNGINGIDIISF